MREKFDKYFEVISGYAFKSADLLPIGDVPVIKIGNISNGSDVVLDDDTQYVSSDFLRINDKYHIHKGDVLISLTGSHMNQPNSVVGRTCRNYGETEFLLNQRAGKVIPRDGASIDYLYYLLSSKAIKENIVTRAYGAANQINISPSAIGGIKWSFPEFDDQEKIGKVLSLYDQLVYKNNQRIKLLEQMAENLYKEWFVRFRFPDYENTEFNDGVPVGWHETKLTEFGITLDSGSRPSGGIDEKLEDGMPSLGAEAIKGLGEFDYGNVRLIPYEFYDKMKRGKNTGKDILLYKDGAYIGKVTLFMNDFPYAHFAVNEHVFLLNSNDTRYQFYLYFTLHQKEYFSLMQNLNRNAAQPGLSKPDIYRIKVMHPAESVIEEFNRIIEPILNNVFNLSKQNTYLIKQRDLLLPRLMSGKLQVN